MSLKLPEALNGKYRLTQPVKGGPVFDFPAQGLYKVNLTTLSEWHAELLVQRGCLLIERVAPKEPVKLKDSKAPANGE
jgi:hypothetical protein